MSDSSVEEEEEEVCNSWSLVLRADDGSDDGEGGSRSKKQRKPKERKRIQVSVPPLTY